MTDAANQALFASPPAPVRPEPALDRFGRYRIPHPVTGKDVNWTRATTWAKSIADTYGLELWKLRMTAIGLTQRQDLFLGVASLAGQAALQDDKDAKRKLDQICESAKEHAGASSAANIGTALHEFSHQFDIGRQPRVPEPWSRDLEAYQAALLEHRVEISPRYVERVVLLPELSVAGTMDRLVRWQGGLAVADIKTGADLDYSWPEISIQLALYSRASWVWDTEEGSHFRMPAGVNQNYALVFHLPVGRARCDLYLVDIEAGWEAASLCGQVRNWRKRKNLATQIHKEATA